jgi:hypothetical protein
VAEGDCDSAKGRQQHGIGFELSVERHGIGDDLQDAADDRLTRLTLNDRGVREGLT